MRNSLGLETAFVLEDIKMRPARLYKFSTSGLFLYNTRQNHGISTLFPEPSSFRLKTALN